MDTGNLYTSQLTLPFTSVTSVSGNLTLDLTKGNNFFLNISETTLLTNITVTPKLVGSSFALVVVQDATPRTLTYGSMFKFSTTIPDLPETEGSQTLIVGLVISETEILLAIKPNWIPQV